MKARERAQKPARNVRVRQETDGLGGGVSGARLARGRDVVAAGTKSPVGINSPTLTATTVIFGCVEITNPGVGDSPHAQFITTAAFWAASSRFWQQLGSFLAGSTCAVTAPLPQPQLFAPGWSPQQQVASPETLQHFPPATVPVVTVQPMLPAKNTTSVTIAVRRFHPVGRIRTQRRILTIVSAARFRLQANVPHGFSPINFKMASAAFSTSSKSLFL